MMRRLFCAALALTWLAALPGCSEFDGIFPWNWSLPVRIKPYDRLPGKGDVEEKKREQERKDREAAALLKQKPPRLPEGADSLAPAASKKK